MRSLVVLFHLSCRRHCGPVAPVSGKSFVTDSPISLRPSQPSTSRQGRESFMRLKHRTILGWLVDHIHKFFGISPLSAERTQTFLHPAAIPSIAKMPPESSRSGPSPGHLGQRKESRQCRRAVPPVHHRMSYLGEGDGYYFEFLLSGTLPNSIPVPTHASGSRSQKEGMVLGIGGCSTGSLGKHTHRPRSGLAMSSHTKQQETTTV